MAIYPGKEYLANFKITNYLATPWIPGGCLTVENVLRNSATCCSSPALWNRAVLLLIDTDPDNHEDNGDAHTHADPNDDRQIQRTIGIGTLFIPDQVVILKKGLKLIK